MMYWYTVVAVLSLLLLLYLLWKEMHRLNKAWRAARVAASIAAVAGLAGMVLPVSYNKKITGVGAAEAVVLTEGYHPDSLRHFLNHHTGATVFSLVKGAAPHDAVFLPDVMFLNNDTNRFHPLHLLGNGLNEDELASIGPVPFLFHPTGISNGFTAIHWSRQLSSGDAEIVQGGYANGSGAAVQLVLEGFGGALDSVVVPARQTTAFQLRTTPRHLGRAVYSVLALQGPDTLANEPLPIEVVSTKPISILLLAAYPDFENKFLKNWLAQNGYPVAVRTRISQQKFSREHSNLPGISIGGITAAVLSRFDVVVADAAELTAISGAELAALQTAVNRQGMGLLVKVDSATSGNRFYGSSFPLVQQPGTTPVAMQLHFTADTATPAASLKTVQPLYIRPLPGTQPLLQTAKGQVVVSCMLQGRGKVLLTTLTNTYTWQLAGKDETYATLWSVLLQQAATKVPLSEAFSVQPALPVVDEKATVRLQTAYPEPPQVLAGSTAISPEQHHQLPFVWQGSYWPRQGGWVPLLTGHQTVSWQYIFGKNDWQTVRAETKKRLTQNRAVGKSGRVFNKLPIEKHIATEVPKAWFFGLFLVAAAFLWFERKYHNG